MRFSAGSCTADYGTSLVIKAYSHYLSKNGTMRDGEHLFHNYS